MTSRAFIAGCLGTSLTADERAFFRDARPWGFILFRRNTQSPGQVAALTAEMRETVGWHAPVLIDQEGGRVQRMGPPNWPKYPAARSFLGINDPVRQRGIGVASVQRLESVQGRQRAVALAETLHPPAFLVHAHQQRSRRGLADRLRQLRHLRARGEIAGKQGHPGAGRVRQQVALARGEHVPGEADQEHVAVSCRSSARRSSSRHCEYGRAASARL